MKKRERNTKNIVIKLNEPKAYMEEKIYEENRKKMRAVCKARGWGRRKLLEDMSLVLCRFEGTYYMPRVGQDGKKHMVKINVIDIHQIWVNDRNLGNYLSETDGKASMKTRYPMRAMSVVIYLQLLDVIGHIVPTHPSITKVA